MTFDATLAMVRFGTGLGPRFTRPAGVDSMLADLRGDDALAAQFPIPGMADTMPSHAAMVWVERARKEAAGTPFKDAALEARKVLRDEVKDVKREFHLATLARGVDAPLGLRERLVAFWADHFTVRRRSLSMSHLVRPYVEDAIRPYVMGPFSQMLRAVIQHPMMLIYLDQVRSVGPKSEVGKKRKLGLNENLARELLELHLIGSDGFYSQRDVRELAELLTGLSYSAPSGFYYDRTRAEPGAETVMGLTFDRKPRLRTVLQAMDDLAMLPQTGTHLARKMAVHFVNDNADPNLVAAMASAYDTRGDLGDMTTAMLRHDAAWSPTRAKVRQPEEFIVAAMRALGVTGDRVMQFDRRGYNSLIARPLRTMGQPVETPSGPDGWPEDAAEWIIPQAVAARINWAMRVPNHLVDALPDPRDFVFDALGPRAGEDVRFAANAAEKRQDGVGVILASAAFQRR